MANDVKWTDWRSFETSEQPSGGADTNPRTALLQLLGCVIGLGTLTVVLPGPASWVDVLSGSPMVPPGLVSIGAAAETAILVTAAVLVWLLLAWVLAVWIAAIAGRLPGAPGRCGRAILRRIAPATAGRIVAAAVGVSLLAGTSACAFPAVADLGSGVSTPVVGSTTTSTPAPLGGGAGVVDAGVVDTGVVDTATSTTATTPATTDPASLADILSSISIDWPAVPSPTSTVDTAAQPTSGAQVDTAAPAGTTPADTTTAAVTTAPGATAPGATAPDTTAPITTAPITTAPETVADSARTTAEPSAEPSTPTPESGAPNADAADAPPAPTTAAAPANAENDAAIPAPTVAPAQPGSLAGGRDSARGVAVLPGDTLWSIAQHHLKPDATDQEIDTAWRTWYSANAQVIGDNPDLIQPGQLLLPPDPEKGH